MPNRTSRLLILASICLFMAQCKTFDRSLTKNDDSDPVGELTRLKLRFAEPYSMNTHYPPPLMEGKKCVKDAYQHYFDNKDASNSFGPALGWWEESQNDILAIRGEEWNVKHYLVILNLEIKCITSKGPDGTFLPGCSAGDKWAPYRQLSYALKTDKEPLLARNLLILMKKNYFTAPANPVEAPCSEGTMSSADLEMCVRHKVTEYQSAEKCKDLPSYQLIHGDEKLSSVNFAHFVANNTWRTFKMQKIDLFPFIGSLPLQDPYVMRVPLNRQESAYAGDLVVLSEAGKGLVTKLAFYNPSYHREAFTTPPVVVAKYQAPDGEKIIAEIEKNLDVDNEIRIKNVRIVPRGTSPITRGQGDEPVNY